MADDIKHIKGTKSAADRYFLGTNVFGSHKAAENLSKNETSVGVLFFYTGYLEISGKNGWRVQSVVKSLGSVYSDENTNGRQDKPESKKTYNLIAVAENSKNDGKIYVSADATAFSDALQRVYGNQIMVLDAIRFLT